MVPKLLENLEKPNDSVVVASLKTLGNIANGNDNQSQYLIDIGIIPKLESMLFKNKKAFRK